MKTKTQFTNRILSFMLTIVMVLGMLPMNLLTASAAETTKSAIDLSTLTGTYVISDSGEYTFTGSGSYGIKVESGNPTIVLNNASITVGEGSAIDVASGSNATIFVLGDNTIGTTKTESWNAPCGGIFVAEGGTVNITSNGTNNILRAHGTLAAAIGGKYDYDNNESYNAGSINISNVTVYAYTNNFYASAIGAAGEGTCGTINITNAVVYVYGAGDRWTSAPGIGNAWSLLDWSDTIPIVIISDSEVHTFRYNPYSDYIGYLGDESGDTYATGSINCGDGGSVKNSTIYCYTGLDATTTDKVVKYGALGGLLKEDGTCEGEHSGGTATCTTLAVCENCGASYGELLDHNWKNGECTYGCNTQHNPHDWESGICNVCGLVCAHTGGAATCTTLAVCDICGTSYGEVGGHTPAENATYTDNGDGTHTFTCSACGASINKAHSMDSTTGKCVCSLEMAEASATIGGVTTYYSTLDAAIWAVRYTTEADNAIVKLLMDCEHVNIEGGVFTLNLAGNSLSTENTQSAVLDVFGGTVTVTGGTISGTRKAVEVVGGTLNITEGTTITTTENHTNSKTVKVRGGTLNISGGTITGPVKGVFVQDGTVNITGGTIETQGNKESGSVYIEGGTVNISGGSFIDKFALYMEGGTAYVTGGTFQSSNRYALNMLGGTAYVTGGTFTSDGYADISCTNGTVIFGMNEESGVGATFPNDLTVSDTTLNAILADGASYWQGEKMIVPSEDQTQINGGDVIIKAACDHIGSQHTAVTDNHDGAHIYDCTLCGATIVEEHSFENDAHKCVCGKVETFTVSWILSASLMQSTSTFGQEFTQTFTVPENTHLEIDSVYLRDDPSVPVNYTYENGVLTIAAEDVPAADIEVLCNHYVLVTFHANGGELIPEDGFPQEGSNDIFPEDGSYWTQEWNYWSEICLVNCAAVRREGYTFVDWRDASGQVHQVIPGYGNYTLATEDITLYAQWQCNHTIGGVVFRDNGNGTHNGYCGECDELLGNYVERPHDFGNNTHKCICGKKITPEVTAPTTKENLLYDGTSQELINPGSTTGGTLQYSLDNVTWSAEIPTAITVGTHTVYYKVVGDENYEDVAVQSISATIVDKTAPTGTILIKENGWNKFWNTITFGIFCKEYVDVTVTADGTGSGVAKVEHLLSGTVLEKNNLPVDGWTTLNADNGSYRFSIQPQNKVAVYVRITDEGGNETIINSDGIVVYEDSKAVDTEVTYIYKENSNKDISVEFNSNTVKSIVCSEKVLAANTDYSVDYESGKIVLKATYLDALNAGDYTYTVSYNPMGVENSGVTDLTTTFTVKVEPTSIAGATVNVSAIFTYDGNAKTPDPMVVLNGETLVKDRDYTVSYAENVNAGTATVTVTGKGNYSGTKTATFSIAPMELDETNTVVTLDQNTFAYDGTEHKPAVTVTFNGVMLTEGVDYRVFYSIPMKVANGKVEKWFSDHTTSMECVNVDGDYYAVVVGLGNFRTKDAFTLYANFVIEKATVIEPTIATKPYTGSEQTADVTDTDLYTVVKNEGGTGVKENGCYDVVLELKDPVNYKWSTTDNAQVTLQFKITRAENEWTVDPSITGWTYGETAKAPVGEAKFGEVSVEYSGTTNGGAAYNGVAAPTEAGSYTATFIVQETEDYKGLETSVDFTIEKADYNMRGAKWNYREPFKYDGKEHKVEVVGLPTGVTVESYENNTATAVGDYYAEVNLTYDAHNYNAPTISKLGWTIYNDWSPTEYTATTPNGNGWLNSDFVITANDGHKVSLTNTADGDWKDALTYSGETADGSVTFYLKNETDGTISLAKTVSYKLDKTVPTGKVEFVDRAAWEKFVNTITFGLFFKDEVTVKATANDTLSGVDKIEYASADKAMTLDEVKAIADWTEYNGEFGVTLEDAKKFVYFVRITDKAGNVTYLSTDGAEYDTTAPVLYGIENGGVYHGDKVFKATDDNFLKIEVDGVDITNTTEGDNEFEIVADNAEHTVTVTDKAGNVTEYKITVYKKYMVTYSNGDGGSYEKEFKYGEVITIPTNEFFKDTFRKTGHIVKEWQGYTEGMTMPLKDLTFTAVYVPCEYTVTFEENGGEEINPITVTFGEKYGSLPSSAITGLSGGNKNWYLVDADGNVTETNIKNLTIVSTARNHKLFIKRNVLVPSVSIALTVPGGISDGYQYYIPGASTRVLTATIGNMNTDVLDYTYQWYKDGILIEGAASNVLTLDGNVSDSGTYKVEVTAKLKDGTNIVVGSDTATASKEQKVKILHAANTLCYDANGGEGGPQSAYTGGTILNVSKDLPTREFYDFTGWNTVPDGTGDSYKADDAYTFTNDNGNGGCEVTLYAQWKLVEYTVTYMADGESVSTETVGHGKDVILPAVPAKDGYVGKWDSDGKNIIGDTTITAVYTAIPVVKPDEVKPEDEAELEDTKKQLEDMLDDDSYTDNDKKDIQDAIDDIDDALEVIENVEAVEKLIDKLPDTIKKDDEPAIKAADNAYNALTDYEKSFVDEDAKKALADAKAALAELNKPADTDNPQTGDNSNMFLWIALLFISGGAVITLTVIGKKRMASKR